MFLIGPNGVGKTVLAKAFIKESGCQSVVIDYNDIDKEEDVYEKVLAQVENFKKYEA